MKLSGSLNCWSFVCCESVGFGVAPCLQEEGVVGQGRHGNADLGDEIQIPQPEATNKTKGSRPKPNENIQRPTCHVLVKRFWTETFETFSENIQKTKSEGASGHWSTGLCWRLTPWLMPQLEKKHQKKPCWMSPTQYVSGVFVVSV